MHAGGTHTHTQKNIDTASPPLTSESIDGAVLQLHEGIKRATTAGNSFWVRRISRGVGGCGRGEGGGGGSRSRRNSGWASGARLGDSSII